MKKTNQINKINYHIRQQIDQEIMSFKDMIDKKYGINLYVAIPAAEITKTPTLTLSDIWDLLFEIIADNHPKYMSYKNANKRVRDRAFMNYIHVFNYVARNHLYATFESIGQFTNVTHASVMSSVKVATNYKQTGDLAFMQIYEVLTHKINDYVRALSEDTEVQDNA